MTRRPIPITRHISLIYRYAQRFLSGRLRDFPLEAGQLPLMLQLYRYPGVTQEQLAQRLAIDKGTAARGWRSLRRMGLSSGGRTLPTAAPTALRRHPGRFRWKSRFCD